MVLLMSTEHIDIIYCMLPMKCGQSNENHLTPSTFCANRGNWLDLLVPNHPIWRIFHYHPAIGIPWLRKSPMKFQCLPNCSIPPWGDQRTGVLWTREIRRNIITWYDMYVIMILHHIIIYYLVGGLESGTFFMFPYIGNSTPNWLMFFRGVGIPPTSYQHL